MRAAFSALAFAASLLIACGGNEDASSADMAADSRAQYPAGKGAGGAVSTSRAAPEGMAVATAPVAVAPPPPTPFSPEEGPQLPTTPQVTPSPSAIPSMVIRTGDARVEVDSLEIALARLQALATQLGGFIGNTSMQVGEREVRQATVEMKVPSDRFEAARSGLSGIGKVEYVNVQAQDVGEEFVDMTARMENARRLEQRLVGLLASRTGRLEEVLSVERELNRIREQIERYEGRLRYLRTRVAVSTLMINIHEKTPLVGELGSGNRIVEAFRNAWRNFVGFLALFIESLGVLIPIAIIAAVVARWLWRRRPPTAQPPVHPAADDRVV